MTDVLSSALTPLHQIELIWGSIVFSVLLLVHHRRLGRLYMWLRGYKKEGRGYVLRKNG